jgi:LuxR family maltose regulon positive regulatory protein
MVVSGVDRRADRQRRGNGPAFDLFASKLRRPLMRPGTVRRSLLIDRLMRDDPGPIVSVVAAPGYGKTTLLSQWAERNGQAFAWVSVEEPDNDPRVLLEHREPEVVPVLRRRAAGWCVRNELPEEALEYSMAAGDADAVAGLLEKQWLPAYRQGRITTVERWFGWLEARGGIEGYPMLAVLASLTFALTARPADAERWADAIDRWQYGSAAWPDHPSAEAWAALVRAVLCRHGVEQMRADADEAARRFAAEHIEESAPVLYQGLARVFSGGPDAGEACFEEALSIREEARTPEALAVALCELSLLAMARGEWSRAEAHAERAGAVLRRAGLEGTLTYAVQARAAMHRGDVPAVRQHLVNAQRVRPLLTYAIPHVAVQARIELARVHLALGDLAGARTLMREIDELPGSGLPWTHHRPSIPRPPRCSS